MKQRQRYLAFALVLFGADLLHWQVYGFTSVTRVSRYRTSVFSYPDELRTREVFEDDEDDDEMFGLVGEPPLFSLEDVNGAQPMNGAEEKEDSNSGKDILLEDERTLYEILGASQNATREELKQKYVRLARETHPDATVGLSPEEREEKEVLFTEVAAAWRILSDKRERKRYDRSLLAKKFTQNVEQVAGEYADRVARTAAPAVSRVLESLFKSGAGPDSAQSLNDAAEKIRAERREREERVARAEQQAKATRQVRRANGEKVDVRSAIASAISKGKQISRAIDRYELLRKSRELEQISMNEIERSMAIKGELANVMNKRLSLSLRTPNSALTSSEALKLLDGLNTVDSVTLLESIRFKHPLIHDINCLEEVEIEYNDKSEEYKQAKEQLTETKDALWKADLKAEEAVKAEEAARRALEEAQRQVIATRQDLMDWNRMYAIAEAQYRKTSQEMERIALALERKQEKVRMALRRKEEEMLNVPVTKTNLSLDTLGLADLERLRKEEGYLREESKRLDDRAKRLRSRARKLKRRCEELKAEEELTSRGNKNTSATDWKQQ